MHDGYRENGGKLTPVGRSCAATTFPEGGSAFASGRSRPQGKEFADGINAPPAE